MAQARQSTAPHRNAALNPAARIVGEMSMVARAVMVLIITKTAIGPNKATPNAAPTLRMAIIMLDATPSLPLPQPVPRIWLMLGGKKSPSATPKWASVAMINGIHVSMPNPENNRSAPAARRAAPVEGCGGRTGR